jgi:hypothetical protein
MTRFNAERSTLNAQFRQLGVGCWMLDVFASMKSKRIVVMGFMGSCPIAGVIWQHVHYIVGLQRLGHEVYCISCEDIPMIVANTQHPTPNAEHRIQRSAFCIRRWAFDVQRSAFSSQ